MEQTEIAIDRNFFDRPGEFPVLDKFKVPFTQWLIGYGLANASAEAVAARLPSYFVFALNQEWRHRPELYAPIREVDTPFTRAAELEQGWLSYSSWLQKQVDESLLNETFSLRQIYVPLRAFCEQKADKGQLSFLGPAPERRTMRIVVDAAAELDAWIDRADHTDAVRIISGGPGCGKSSFTKIYAAHASHTPNRRRSGENGGGDGPNDARAVSALRQIRVLYIPLHQFDPKADLISAVGDFIQSAQLLPHNPLHPDSREERLLILFDGLDELAMQGRAGAEVAREFVEEVNKNVDNANH